MNKLTFIVGLFAVLHSRGQINNLVPNGEFEVKDTCFSPLTNLYNVPNWDCAVANAHCSSDIYLSCFTTVNTSLTGQFYEGRGIKYKNDTSCAGIFLKTDKPDYREYLQTKIDEGLSRDSCYVVEISLIPGYQYASWGIYVNRLEIKFSDNRLDAGVIDQFIPARLNVSPDLVYNEFMSDTSKWTEISWIYWARGDEKYMTIGNFSHDSLIDMMVVNDGYPSYKVSYYLIDDVKVYKCSDTIPKPELVPILPNVFSPNQDGINDIYEVENPPQNGHLQVYNRWGTLVYEQRGYNNLWQGQSTNGNELAEGVYFVLLTYTNATNEVKQLKQTVHLVR